MPVHTIYLSMPRNPGTYPHVNPADIFGAAGQTLVEFDLLHPTLVVGPHPANFPYPHHTRYELADAVLIRHLLLNRVITIGLMATIGSIMKNDISALPSRLFPIQLTDEGLFGGGSTEPYRITLEANGQPRMWRGDSQPQPRCITAIVPGIGRTRYGPAFGRMAAKVALAALGVNYRNAGAVAAFFGPDRMKFVYLPFREPDGTVIVDQWRGLWLEHTTKMCAVTYARSRGGYMVMTGRDGYTLPEHRGPVAELMRGLRDQGGVPFVGEDFAYAQRVDESVAFLQQVDMLLAGAGVQGEGVQGEGTEGQER